MKCLAFLLSVDLLIFWFIIQSVDLKFWYANIKFYSVDLACCWFNFFKLRLGALRPRSVGQSVGLLVGPPKITKKMTKLYKTFQTIKEELLWQKTTFDRRQPLAEDDLWQKTAFDRRWPLTEDDPQWKRTFDRVTVYYLNKIFTPHLYSHSTTDSKSEILSAVYAGNRISRDGRNVCGIMHVNMCRKDNIFWQRGQIV